MSNASKYIEAVINFRESKWACIALSNLAESLSREDILKIQKEVNEIVIQKRKEQLSIYLELKAPEVVVVNAKKRLQQAINGKTTEDACLRRALAKK